MPSVEFIKDLSKALMHCQYRRAGMVYLSDVISLLTLSNSALLPYSIFQQGHLTISSMFFSLYFSSHHMSHHCLRHLKTLHFSQMFHLQTELEVMRFRHIVCGDAGTVRRYPTSILACCFIFLSIRHHSMQYR